MVPAPSVVQYRTGFGSVDLAISKSLTNAAPAAGSPLSSCSRLMVRLFAPCSAYTTSPETAMLSGATNGTEASSGAAAASPSKKKTAPADPAAPANAACA